MAPNFPAFPISPLIPNSTKMKEKKIDKIYTLVLHSQQDWIFLWQKIFLDHRKQPQLLFFWKIECCFLGYEEYPFAELSEPS
jgi:hypothetical protein